MPIVKLSKNEYKEKQERFMLIYLLSKLEKNKTTLKEIEDKNPEFYKSNERTLKTYFEALKRKNNA